MAGNQRKTKIVAGNWKMNLLRPGAEELASAIAAAPRDGVEVVLFPPFTLIETVRAVLAGGDGGIALGGQDCHQEAAGAFTGEVAASMLADAGCQWALLGHSERRTHFGEGSSLVAAKAAQALDAGLDAMVCVGETIEERGAGTSEGVVEAQLRESIPAGTPAERLAVAYEPVWAIGTGNVPEEADIVAMHAAIGAVLGDIGAEGAPILYGGSVNAGNAVSILGLDGVDGALVGGASLKSGEFSKIVDAGSNTTR